MKKHLLKDLRAEGASANEAKNLVRLAEQLQQAKPRGLSARAKQRMYDELPINAPKEHRPVFRWAMAGSLAGAMALLVIITQVVLPGGKISKPTDKDTKALIQPAESKLQQLDTKIDELQQQPDINQQQLQQTEDQYRRTLDDFKKQYQNNKQFKNYDWNKWQRGFTTQSYQKNDHNAHAGGMPTSNTFRNRGQH